MWNGKTKAVTFSIDDGDIGDKRIVEIFNKYGIKGTFNLNSGLLEKEGVEKTGKMKASEVFEIYQGHEIAVHTCTHPNLTFLQDDEIIREVEEDRKALEKLVGYKIVGMAYPCGGVNNNKHVANVIKENTLIKYARTITSTYNFNLQKNMLQFNPTIYWIEESLRSIVQDFINLKTDKPQLLYIWGHAFELDRATEISYQELEDICKLLSTNSDIFFGTNREVFEI